MLLQAISPSLFLLVPAFLLLLAVLHLIPSRNIITPLVLTLIAVLAVLLATLGLAELSNAESVVEALFVFTLQCIPLHILSFEKPGLCANVSVAFLSCGTLFSVIAAVLPQPALGITSQSLLALSSLPLVPLMGRLLSFKIADPIALLFLAQFLFVVSLIVRLCSLAFFSSPPELRIAWTAILVLSSLCTALAFSWYARIHQESKEPHPGDTNMNSFFLFSSTTGRQTSDKMIPPSYITSPSPTPTSITFAMATESKPGGTTSASEATAGNNFTPSGMGNTDAESVLSIPSVSYTTCSNPIPTIPTLYTHPSVTSPDDAQTLNPSSLLPATISTPRPGVLVTHVNSLRPHRHSLAPNDRVFKRAYDDGCEFPPYQLHHEANMSYNLAAGEHGQRAETADTPPRLGCYHPPRDNNDICATDSLSSLGHDGPPNPLIVVLNPHSSEQSARLRPWLSVCSHSDVFRLPSLDHKASLGSLASSSYSYSPSPSYSSKPVSDMLRNLTRKRSHRRSVLSLSSSSSPASVKAMARRFHIFPRSSAKNPKHPEIDEEEEEEEGEVKPDDVRVNHGGSRSRSMSAAGYEADEDRKTSAEWSGDDAGKERAKRGFSFGAWGREGEAPSLPPRAQQQQPRQRKRSRVFSSSFGAVMRDRSLSLLGGLMTRRPKEENEEEGHEGIQEEEENEENEDTMPLPPMFSNAGSGSSMLSALSLTFSKNTTASDSSPEQVPGTSPATPPSTKKESWAKRAKSYRIRKGEIKMSRTSLDINIRELQSEDEDVLSDFMDLRDPFAPPNLGARGSVTTLSSTTNVENMSTRRSTSRLGGQQGTNGNTDAAWVLPPDLSPYLPSFPSSPSPAPSLSSSIRWAEQEKPPCAEARRKTRKVKARTRERACSPVAFEIEANASEQSLLASDAPAAPECKPEGLLDVEEALLTQRLLMRLDSPAP